MGAVNDMLRDVALPRGVFVRQTFPGETLPDPVEALRLEFQSPRIRALLRPGMTVAITAGSRGIDCYVPLLRELIRLLKEAGVEPFVFPAMGSHGGATAQGQQALLAGYGITRETVGAPIRATMEVVQVDTTDAGEPVWADKLALEADGIILFNRVKPHTGFRGEFESGLVKMAAIGLGKQKGAETVHGGGPAVMGHRVLEFGARAIRSTQVILALATVENAFDKVCDLRLLTKEEIFTEEPRLLEKAKGNLPRILFEGLDVLAVDRIGKNISGPGMDPNITHTYLPGAAIPEELRARRAQRVAVLDLTEETHGAAMGVGMADVTTRRLFKKMDFDMTYPNCLTGGVTVSAKLPMVFDSDRLALQAAVKTLVGADRSRLRMVRIRDTLHLGQIWISEALIPEAEAHPHAEILSDPAPLAFDRAGNLF